jgi:nucleoid DNA-binding protein
MERKGNILNKGYIVRKLQERGLSRRRSVQILNFILDEAAAALASGEDVEFPFGSLQRVRHPHKKMDGWFLGTNTTIYKKPYTVALEVDAESEVLLNKRIEVAKSPRAPIARAGYTGLRIPVRLPPRPALTRSEPDIGTTSPRHSWGNS